jgi:hypothetical protein
MEDLLALMFSPESSPKEINCWNKQDTEGLSPLESRITSSANARWHTPREAHLGWKRNAGDEEALRSILEKYSMQTRKR